ncbi:hypothetical protein [Simplicispira metamorpha]|uniref:Uncharacterized protein n=1 Tax=Simplicispira metamorpha TaxID=80881 RepID=A0A4R2NEL4_9BURK|nr:hypothetical protein [Simplicispira metamorpha]TCP19545.1 hypothetical protein EV674_1042 [Simplicispira metamorpha]
MVLVLVVTESWGGRGHDQANAAFEQHQDMAPHTLDHCLHELEFWDALYHLRNGWAGAKSTPSSSWPQSTCKPS